MVEKIKREEGGKAAVDLLDTLRDIRQTHHNIRMVFTGSIGFHHVLSALAEEDVVSGLVNDMKRLNVEALARTDGMLLAKKLLIGERLAVADMEGTTAALHDLTGGIPYYIHHIVADLIPHGSAAPEDVLRKIQDALTDPNDPWYMRHFNTRLPTYYQERAPAARTVLDTLAKADSPLTLKALQDAVNANSNAAGTELDRHAMLELLRKMMQDHYLTQEREGEKRYGILFPLIKRWWLIERGLE
jgi:hypothetical protein